MHIHFSWNFKSDVYTLTIYFIALNVSVEFVLIYRPHPVHASGSEEITLEKTIPDRGRLKPWQALHRKIVWKRL